LNNSIKRARQHGVHHDHNREFDGIDLLIDWDYDNYLIEVKGDELKIIF